MTDLFSSSVVYTRSGGGPQHEIKKWESEHLLQSYAERCVSIGPPPFAQHWASSTPRETGSCTPPPGLGSSCEEGGGVTERGTDHHLPLPSGREPHSYGNFL